MASIRRGQQHRGDGVGRIRSSQDSGLSSDVLRLTCIDGTGEMSRPPSNRFPSLLSSTLKDTQLTDVGDRSVGIRDEAVDAELMFPELDWSSVAWSPSQLELTHLTPLDVPLESAPELPAIHEQTGAPYTELSSPEIKPTTHETGTQSTIETCAAATQTLAVQDNILPPVSDVARAVVGTLMNNPGVDLASIRSLVQESLHLPDNSGPQVELLQAVVAIGAEIERMMATIRSQSIAYLLAMDPTGRATQQFVLADLRRGMNFRPEGTVSIPTSQSEGINSTDETDFIYVEDVSDPDEL